MVKMQIVVVFNYTLTLTLYKERENRHDISQPTQIIITVLFQFHVAVSLIEKHYYFV